MDTLPYSTHVIQWHVTQFFIVATYAISKWLQLGMARGQGSDSIYRSPWLIWCCPVSTFYTLLQFQSFLHLYHIIQIQIFLMYKVPLYNIPHFTMKHDNYDSYMLSILLEHSYLAMNLSLCFAQLVSCDFHNLQKCSKYALHISTWDFKLLHNQFQKSSCGVSIEP